MQTASAAHELDGERDSAESTADDRDDWRVARGVERPERSLSRTLHVTQYRQPLVTASMPRRFESGYDARRFTI
jgi:hypothetical protein